MMIRSAALSVALSTIAALAHADTVNYTLSGNPADATFFHRDRAGVAYTFTDLPLQAATSGGIAPGFTAHVGDALSGTVTLSAPVTLPASLQGATLGLDLQVIDDDDYFVQYDQSLTFYDAGHPVATPPHFTYFGASGGELTLGFVNFDGGDSPAFTFDKIVFDATITGFFDGQSNPLDSVLLDDVQPDLFFQTYANVSSVPEPAPVWLALLGLGLMASFMRAKRS